MKSLSILIKYQKVLYICAKPARYLKGVYMARKISAHDLEVFKLHCREVKNAVRVFRTKNDCLVAELPDGSAILYDLILDGIRSAMNLDILLRPKTPNNENDFRKYLARKIYREMLRRGYDQLSLSEITGISEATISRYINGTSMPTMYKMTLIASALDCTVDDLITFDC